MDIVLVATGDYYGDSWWTDNMEHMLWEAGAEFDQITIINDVVYGGVFDKLRVFDICRDYEKQYLYLDLDMVIHSPIDHLLRDNLTVLHAWWREKLHTPYNSSVMSWKGDYSFIYQIFQEDPEFYMTRYNKGIDEYLYRNFDVDKYPPVCNSKNYGGYNDIWPICLFNQAAHDMRKPGEWTKYLLSGWDKSMDLSTKGIWTIS